MHTLRFLLIRGSRVCDGARWIKLSVPGPPSDLDNGRERACCACSRCG